MVETTHDIQMESLNREPVEDTYSSTATAGTEEVELEEPSVRITRRMAREQGGIPEPQEHPQLKSALGSRDEPQSRWEAKANSAEITGFDRITSFTAFMMGLMMNWGSFNVMGFMMGMNYSFFLKRDNNTRFLLDLQTVFPAFILGVFLVNIHLMYFTASVVAGYTYRSRGSSLQENVALVYDKIPKRYRDSMRFGTRNEFLRRFIGVISETSETSETSEKKKTV